jgi:ubiquinone/menaquinone biosynthesis C-methylase UbiE
MKDITGKYELPDWWNKSLDNRYDDWLEKYTRVDVGYDEYVGQFTFNTRKYTGEWLLNEIKKDGEDVKVLDVGCGKNPFKGKVKNVIGVEPGTWGNADMQLNLDGAWNLFKPNTFDWVLAIGILHHHDTDDIHLMIKQLMDLVKPGGKVACLCKPFANDKEAPYLYPWSFETTKTFTALHNLKYYLEPVEDYTILDKIPNDIKLYEVVTNNKTRERIFWIWEKDTTQKK